jgi:hypothetical protein
VLRRQPLPASPPLSGPPGVPSPARAGFVDPTRARCADSRTPSPTLSSLPQHPEFGPTGLGPSPRAAHQGCTRFLDPRRLPPADPVGLDPRLRSGRGPRAATGTPTSPPWAQLPTCVHARLRRTLGPSPLPAFTGAPGPHAAYRLLQRSVPRAQPRIAQTSSHLAAANRCATEWPPPLRDSTSRASSGQGSLRRFRLSNPHRDNRLPRWIYPNLIDSGTPCHELVPNLAWNDCKIRRPCGTGLSRTNPPSRPRRNATCLLGPSPTRPRERARSRPHPGCLPPPRPPVSGWRGPAPADCSTDADLPTPLLPTATSALT